MAVRPSKVELLKNVSPEKLDQPCKDGDLIKLSHSITDWEYIACLLGLTNPEIQAIKTNSNSEECRRIMMLRTWNGKYNFKATYRSLIDIFYTYELTDLVTKVCDDINIQRSNTSGRSVINPNEPTPRQKTPLQSLQGSQRKRKWHHDQPSPTLDSSLQMSGQQMPPSHVSNSPPLSSLPPSLPLPIDHAATSRTPHDRSSTGGSASQSTPHQTLPHPPMTGTQEAASPNSFTHERYCHPGEIGRPAFPQHHSYQTPLAPIPRQQNPSHSLQGSQRKHKPSHILDNSLQMSGQQTPSHSSFLPTPASSLPLPSEHASNSPPPFSLPNHYSQTPLVPSHHHVPGAPAFFGRPYRVPFQMNSAASDSSMAVYSQQRRQAEFGLFPPSYLSSPPPNLPLPSEHAAASSTCTSGSVSQSVPHQTLPHPPMAQTAASPNSFTHERYREIGRLSIPPHYSYHTPDTRTFPPSPYLGQRFHQMPFQSPPTCIASVSSLPRQRQYTPIRPSFSQHSPMSGYQLTMNTNPFACDSHGLADTHGLQPRPSQEPHPSRGNEAPHIPPDQAQNNLTSHSTTSTGYPQPGHQGQVPVPYLQYFSNIFPGPFPTIALAPPESSVLQSYTIYLRQRYQRRIPSPFTLDWPPPPTRKFFNLSMVQQRVFKYGTANEELTRLMLRGDVRSILNKKREVKLEEICVLDEEPRRVILIEGAPGAGKSTLAWHIVQKWRLGEMFQEFDIVIYVQLRDPAIQVAQSLADILPARSKAMAMEVASELKACDGSRTLFVIDSWDEYPPGLSVPSFFETLICYPERIDTQLSTLIITSRPIATGLLQQFASTRLEIVGFTPHEAKQYFTEALSDSQSVERLQERLRERPVIEASCYLPLNAAIVAHLFLVNQSLPTTLHGVFTSMVICCIIRHMKKDGIQQLPKPQEDSSLEDFVSQLPNGYQQQFLNICTLAYHGVLDNKATFSSRDLQRFKLPVDLSTLSLIQGTESIACYQQSAVLYNFLHLSIQELLAAFHISKMPSREQVEIFKKMFGQPRFAAVFQFYAAFTKLQTKGVREIVATIVKDYVKHQRDYEKSKSVKHQLLSLLHCLYEAQDRSLCKFVASELNGELDLSRTTLSPVDCLAVGYILSEVCLTTSGEFNVFLYSCSLDDYKVSLLVKDLSRCHRAREVQQATDTETSTSFEMEFGDNDIQNEGVHSIAELLSSSNVISKLVLSRSKIQEGGDGLIDLCKALMTNTSLTALGLGDRGSDGYNVTIAESNGPVLSEMLKENRTLKVLCLANERGVSDSGAFHIAKGLKYNTGLEKLDLSQCDMTSEGVEFLADALTVNKQLRVLDLLHNNIGDSGITHIANALKVNSTLKELQLADCSKIWNEDVHDRECYIDEVLVNGAETLASALTVNQQLELLDLSENPLEDSGVSHISNALKTNTNLKQLILQDCGISERGAETLASALAVNATLETLNLSENPISDRGVSQLAEALKHNHTLKELNIRFCSLTDHGMKSLASVLKVNTSLKMLGFSWNTFTDSGLKALGESLRHNRGLERLDLKYLNQVTVEGLKEFVLSLQENSHLREVNVGGTGGGAWAVEEETAIVNHARTRKGLPELKVSDDID